MFLLVVTTELNKTREVAQEEKAAHTNTKAL
jgi:hypothetical protein